MILLIICLMNALMAASQQQGIVRTLERPGKPSETLAGVTINVLEYPNAIVTKKGGKFSFTLKDRRQGDSYTISRIQKKGYSLIDKQVKGRRYAYSNTVPLEIVMVSDQQLENDKKRIEDKAYDKAKKNYDQKVLALENQLKQKTISEREYRQKYEQLNNDYNNYVQMIDQMAERYATTDYKGMSELNREIQMCIENADLERADSLINSKGDFDKREQELNNKRELKAKSEQLTRQLQEDINFELTDLKQDYAHKVNIHAANYRNDSAAYYLERIVKLDTTDIYYVYHTATFVDRYLADYPRALKYYLMTLDYVRSNYGEDDEDAGELCQNIGLLYDNYDQPDKALEWHHKALDILKKNTLDPTSPDVSMAYTLIGRAYLNKGEYDKALEYTLTGLDMRERAAVADTAALAQSYNNLGVLYYQMDDYDKAIEYHLKALEMREQTFGQESDLAAFSHMNIGSQYFNHQDYDNALEHLDKAYHVYHKIYGSAHPYTQRLNQYLSSIYVQQGNYEKALEYLQDYLKGIQQYYGGESLEAARCLITIANVYNQKGDKAHALVHFRHALDTLEQLPNQSDVESTINDIKSVIVKLKQ